LYLIEKNPLMKKLTPKEMKVYFEKEAQSNFKLFAGYVGQYIKSVPEESDEGYETKLYEDIMFLIPSIDECKVKLLYNVNWFWDEMPKKLRADLFTNEVLKLILLNYENETDDYMKIYEERLFVLTTDELYKRLLQEAKCKEVDKI